MTRNNLIGKAPMIRILLVAGAFLFFVPQSRAQFSFDENCQHVYQAVIALQFTEARRLIDAEKKTVPSNLLPVYLENYIDFLTLFIGEDRNLYEVLREKKSDRIDRLESGNRDSPWYNFCLAEVHLQWAFARIKFGDYSAAAFEIRKAHALFSANAERYPAFMINRIGLGVVHVVAGLIPENYRWVASLMGVDGSIETGLNEIRQVAEYTGSDNITLLYKPESMFFLAFMAANLQKNKKEALPVLRFLNSQENDMHLPASPLLIFAKATILMKNGQNDAALSTLRQRALLPPHFPFHYLDFLEGMARLNKLDYSAARYFEQFTVNFKGQNYIRSAWQKIAWISLLRGDTVKYHQTMDLVKSRGVSQVDEDRQALSEATRGVGPNVFLLRARLLSDGGYYSKALDELLGNSIKTLVRSKHDLVEYNYRLGRIYHESGNSAKALGYYRQTIQRGKTEPYYFAASAAYQMGMIFENNGDWSKADSAYRVCLSINTPEYKTSLGQKAKAGLNRVKKRVPKT